MTDIQFDPVLIGSSAAGGATQWFQQRQAIDWLAGPYAQLLAGLPVATPYETMEWIKAALDVLHPDRSLHLLACWAEPESAALLPFIFGREHIHGIPLSTLRLAGYPLSDRMSPAMAAGPDGSIQALLDRVVSCNAPWDALVFNEVPADAPLAMALPAWGQARGYRILSDPASRPARLHLNVPDRAALIRRYPKSLAQRLRRCRKKLESAGRVDFERVQPKPGDVRALVARLKSIEDRSWKGEHGVGIFSTSQRLDFFTRVAHAFAERGWLDIGLLRLDGEVISYRFGFRYKGVYWDYNFAYLPDFQALSPGRILLDEMIQSSVDCGLAAFDASRGDARTGNLLGEWSSCTTQHLHLWIFNETLPARFSHLLQSRLRPLFRRLRRQIG